MADERVWQQEGKTDESGRESTGTTGSEAGSRIQQEAKELAGEARQRGKGFLDEQKRTAGDSLGRLARVLHDTGQRLEEEQPTFARMFEDGAGALDRAAVTLRERDTEGMLREFQNFARRQPALMIGGAVAVGFFFSRLLKSSGQYPESRYQSSEHPENRYQEVRYGEESRQLYEKAGLDVSGLRRGREEGSIPERGTAEGTASRRTTEGIIPTTREEERHVTE